jgi:hypothetical protein
MNPSTLVSCHSVQIQLKHGDPHPSTIRKAQQLHTNSDANKTA